MTEWVKGIPFEDWPQQSRTELKPAMITDLLFRGFGSEAWPLVQAIGYDGNNAYQLMLSVVMPGHSIEPHVDQQADYWLTRVHVPITTNSKAVTIMDEVEHHMEVGKAYSMNVRETHSVKNDGETPRLHFMFDVRK